MVKRKGTTGTSPKAGYRPTKRRADELKREIQNFNKRLNRRLKTVPEHEKMFYPEPLRYKEVLNRLGSSREATQFLKDLKLYKGEGLKLSQYEGHIAVKADITIAKRVARRESLKRKDIQRYAEKIRGERGRFPTQITEDLREVSPKQILEEEERFRGRGRKGTVLQEQVLSKYKVDERAVLLQQRYIYQINQAEVAAILAGTLTPELSEKLNRIREIVSSLTPEQMLIAQVAIPFLAIENTSDTELVLNAVNDFLNEWEGFIALW